MNTQDCGVGTALLRRGANIRRWAKPELLDSLGWDLQVLGSEVAARARSSVCSGRAAWLSLPFFPSASRGGKLGDNQHVELQTNNQPEGRRTVLICFLLL